MAFNGRPPNMLPAYPGEDDHANAQVILNSSMAEPAKDDHAAVREIIDSSLAKLKEWLDWRLQQQDDTLRNLSNVREMQNTSGGGITHATQMTTPNSASKPNDGPSSNPSGFAQKSSCASDIPKDISSSLATSASYIDREQIWLSSLMEVFDQLDLNKSGCIDKYEFMEAAKELGTADTQAMKVFGCLDKSNNGTIERMEWLHVISEKDQDASDDVKLRTEFLSQLVDVQTSRGRIYETQRTARFRLIIRHDSFVRQAWDLLMMFVLLYVALSVPYSLGFGKSKILDSMERATDMFFCCDVLMNFRTSYRDSVNALVVSSKKIAMRYLKSWFLLDFISSVPFDLITEGLLPNLSPVRILKIWQISKVLKLLRLPKIKTVRLESEFMVKWKGARQGYNFYVKAHYASAACSTATAFFTAFLAAHWLACFANAVDGSALDEYFNGINQQPNNRQKYLAALYWAVTSISTVGYGDITPFSDKERAFAMVAMVIGGSVYACIIGTITAIITTLDAHAQRYQKHMSLVESWLDSRSELPVSLRESIRQNFREALLARPVINDSSVVNQLSPHLRDDVAFFLLNDHVRHNPMFLNHPRSALAVILDILQETHAEANESIVQLGDPGIGMYILVLGLARYEEGSRWQPPDSQDTRSKFQHLMQGESFGEEILFCLEEDYTYTVITVVECMFHWISENDFVEKYKNMPELHGKMFAAFLKSRGSGGLSVTPKFSL